MQEPTVSTLHSWPKHHDAAMKHSKTKMELTTQGALSLRQYQHRHAGVCAVRRSWEYITCWFYVPIEEFGVLFGPDPTYFSAKRYWEASLGIVNSVEAAKLPMPSRNLGSPRDPVRGGSSCSERALPTIPPQPRLTVLVRSMMKWRNELRRLAREYGP